MKSVFVILGWIVKAEILISATAGLLFVVIYQFRWKWWASPMGRHMMSFMGGLETLILLAVLNLLWPQMPGRSILRLFAWTVLAFLFVWRTVVLIKVRRDPPLTVEQIDAEILHLEELKVALQE